MRDLSFRRICYDPNALCSYRYRPSRLRCLEDDKLWQACNMLLSSLTHLPLDKMAAILADGISKRIFDDKLRILTRISLKFVPKRPIENNPGLVQIMAWLRSTHIFQEDYTLQWRHNEHKCSTVCQAQIKENTEAQCHWSLWRESTGARLIPLPKGQ